MRGRQARYQCDLCNQQHRQMGCNSLSPPSFSTSFSENCGPTQPGIQCAEYVGPFVYSCNKGSGWIMASGSHDHVSGHTFRWMLFSLKLTPLYYWAFHLQVASNPVGQIQGHLRSFKPELACSNRRQLSRARFCLLLRYGFRSEESICCCGGSW